MKKIKGGINGNKPMLGLENALRAVRAKIGSQLWNRVNNPASGLLMLSAGRSKVGLFSHASNAAPFFFFSDRIQRKFIFISLSHAGSLRG
ncbi:Uncharacterised protein [Yersinia ruckeri]|nr:hypothetical protein QMA0440_00351 [Yersinia ruckeri]KFE40327.1 ribosomal protein L11 methyltransferase [Yersinia ruckeri]CNB77294.1 Uncharacterised protein [Yersinia ruckeri]